MRRVCLLSLLLSLSWARGPRTMRFSDRELARLKQSSTHNRFLDVALASPIDASRKSGKYFLVGMVTCPPVDPGCPFALPGQGSVTLWDDDSPYNGDDEMDTAELDEAGRFFLRGQSNDAPWERSRSIHRHPSPLSPSQGRLSQPCLGEHHSGRG